MTPRTLESLKAEHDAADNRKARDRARSRARELCAGAVPPLAVPEWATLRPLGPPRQAAPAAAPPAVPVEVPAELRRWRQGGPGRVVNVRGDGSVRLTVLGFGADEVATFDDARTAERAVLLGSAQWRAVPRRKAG